MISSLNKVVFACYRIIHMNNLSRNSTVWRS